MGKRVYDIEMNEFLVSQDVVFFEEMFPFVTTNLVLPQATLVQSSSDDDWAINLALESIKRERIDPSPNMIIAEPVGSLTHVDTQHVPPLVSSS